MNTKSLKLNRREILAAGGLAGAALALPGTRSALAADEQTLRFAAGDFGGNLLDPTRGKGETQSLVCGMFDGWWEQDITTGKLKPGIIKEWDLGPDGKTWTMHLRDDVVFHDGSKVTADDFIFSLGLALQDDAWQVGTSRIIFGYPPTTQKIDDYTFTITTPAPSPLMPTIYSTLTTPELWLLPKAYIEKNGIDYFRQNPVGTGPYKFVSLVENSTMEFEAVDYPHWSGIVPDFKHVIVSLVPEETTRLLLLEKGQIDATHSSVGSAINEKKKGFSILTGAGGVSQLNFIGVYLPEAKGSPFSDVRVRQALSLAINRQEIIDTLLGGLGSIPDRLQAMNLDGDDVPAALAAKWKPRLLNDFRYDPDEAKRLLAEAGFANGASADVWTAPDNSAPFLSDLLIAMASYWDKVGFKANIVSVDAAAWAAARRPPLSMQLVGKAGMNATSLAKPGAIDRLQYWTTKGGNLNLFVGSPDEAKMDALYTEGHNTADPARYAQIIDQGLELAEPSFTCVPIVDAPLPVLFGPRVNAVMAPGCAYWSLFFADWKYTGK